MECVAGWASVDGEGGAASPPRDAVSAAGRLCEQGVSETERNFSIAMHLSPFAGFFAPILILAPLVLWLVRKDRSPFNDDHGREVINFGITFLLASLVLSWTIVVPVALLIVAVVSLIRGAIAAGRNEYFRYPMTIRFLS